jgi:hypothetical protein
MPKACAFCRGENTKSVHVSYAFRTVATYLHFETAKGAAIFGEGDITFKCDVQGKEALEIFLGSSA